jgi:hypothetical protein
MPTFERDGERWCTTGQHALAGFRGDANRCRACAALAVRTWRDANRDYVVARNADRRAEYAAERGPLERVCVNPECGKTFVPSRRDARTCTRRCRDRLSYVRRKERV